MDQIQELHFKDYHLRSIFFVNCFDSTNARQDISTSGSRERVTDGFLPPVMTSGLMHIGGSPIKSG